MKQKNLLITIIIIVIVAAGAFYGGMQYQKSRLEQFGTGQFAQGARGFGQTGMMQRRFGGNGAVVGDILSVSGSTMTVKLADGSSKIVLLSSATTINKAATATQSDLKAGEKVAAFGATNSDGSVTATNVQLNPIIRARPSAQPAQ